VVCLAGSKLERAGCVQLQEVLGKGSCIEDQEEKWRSEPGHLQALPQI